MVVKDGDNGGCNVDLAMQVGSFVHECINL